MSKKVTKKAQATRKIPFSAKLGRIVAKHGPGLAVKLGRGIKKGGTGISHAAITFKDGFMEGWEEV